MDEYYGYQTGPTRRQMLARLIIGGLALFIVIALLIWFLFFRNPGESKTADKAKSTETSQSTDSNSNGKKTTNSDNSDATSDIDSGSSSNKHSSSSRDATDSTSSSDSSTDDSTGKKASSPEDLSNTGPGDVVALFVVAVLAGAAFRRYQLAHRSI
jgi:cytoskeletal protein RodZ